VKRRRRSSTRGTFFKPTQPGASADESDSESGDEGGSGSGSDTEDEGGHTPVVVQAKRVSHLPTLAVSIPNASRRVGTPDPSHRLSVFPASAVSAASHAVFSGPLCCACKKPVSQPCWYCVQCAGSTFICWECDAKDDATAVAFGEHDFHTHDLVRVRELVEEQDFSMEERLAELEERFSKHEKNMEERLVRMEGVVDGRMNRVEQLLEQLLSRLGTA